MFNLGNFIEQKTSIIPESCDLSNLLNIFLDIVRSPSFVISIPVLVTWTRLLRSSIIANSSLLNPLIAPLLETCSTRMLRYESLPEDSEDPSLLFLMEDIDTVPERHAFLGNYRRYSVQVIETIVMIKQSDALYHILGQVDAAMRQLYEGQAPFSGMVDHGGTMGNANSEAAENYSKTSMPILRVDAHFTVVEAAIAGYMKWRNTQGFMPEQEVGTETLPPDRVH